ENPLIVAKPCSHRAAVIEIAIRGNARLDSKMDSSIVGPSNTRAGDRAISQPAVMTGCRDFRVINGKGRDINPAVIRPGSNNRLVSPQSGNSLRMLYLSAIGPALAAVSRVRPTKHTCPRKHDAVICRVNDFAIVGVVVVSSDKDTLAMTERDSRCRL